MSEKRCFLYSADCPEGRIFEGDDAIAAALEDGWQDSPAAKAEPKKAPAKKKAAKKVAPKKVAASDNST